ncbi:MAG: hypothetical protein ACOWWH_00375 [Eubacteriaceae bacterium]
MANSGFFYTIWKDLTFGKYLQFLFNFVSENASTLGFVLFLYVIVVFIGRYGGLKYIPDTFENYVILKSKEIVESNANIEPDKLIELVYKGWAEEIGKFPSYIYIKSKRDYWIEKPTLELIEERIDINKEKVSEILVNNGVIKTD